MEKPESVSRYVRSPGDLGLTVIDDLPEMIGGREKVFYFAL
jgi:hypothetical protein